MVAQLISAKGSETADGSATAATVMKYRLDSAPIVVDVGGGYGGAVVLRLKDNEIKPMPFNGANEPFAKTKDGQLAFANRRAEALWKFREALEEAHLNRNGLSFDLNNCAAAEST